MMQAKLRKGKSFNGCEPDTLYFIERITFGYKIVTDDNSHPVMSVSDFWKYFELHVTYGFSEANYEIY